LKTKDIFDPEKFIIDKPTLTKRQMEGLPWLANQFKAAGSVTPGSESFDIYGTNSSNSGVTSVNQTHVNKRL